MRLLRHFLILIVFLLFGIRGFVYSLQNISFSLPGGGNFTFVLVFLNLAMIIYALVQIPAIIGIFAAKKFNTDSKKPNSAETEIFEKIDLFEDKDPKEKILKDVKFAIISFAKVVAIMAILFGIISGIAFLGKYIFLNLK